MSRMTLFASGLLLTAVFTLGCGQANDAAPSARGETAAATNANFVLAEKPTDAQGVAAARESSEDAEQVTVTGRIGGSAAPFVDGIAAFTIVDPALAPCSAAEGCPTPWDYCCDTHLLKDNMATVKVVDADAAVVAQDARQLLGVEELATVVVVGKAERDESGNLTILADKVHVVKN